MVYFNNRKVFKCSYITYSMYFLLKLSTMVKTLKALVF